MSKLTVYQKTELTKFSEELGMLIRMDGSVSAGVEVTALTSCVELKKSIKKLANIKSKALRAIDFNKYNDLELLSMHILANGSGFQATAYADCFSIKAGLNSTPVSKYMDGHYGQIMGAVKDRINEVAVFYGKDSFSGDAAQSAEILLNEYEYWTVLDLLTFFANCKKGHYKKEFQHISVRGLNAEFLMDWAKSYNEVRECAIEDSINENKKMVQEVPKEILKGISGLWEQQEKEKRRLKTIELELKKELYSEMSYKLYDLDYLIGVVQNEVVDIWKKGDAEKIANQLQENWKAYYSEHQDIFVDQKTECEFLKQQVALFENSLLYSKKKNTKSIQEIFIDSLLSKAKECENLFELHRICTGKEDQQKIEDTRFLEYAQAFCVANMDKLNKTYELYRKKKLEAGELPTPKQRFLFRKIRAFAAQVLGSDYVSKGILDYYNIEL